MNRNSVIAIGENKGMPRIYLQGPWLLKAGFEPDARYEANFDSATKTLKLVVSPHGTRKVSGKKNRTIPVIDINTTVLSDVFGSADKLQVTAHSQTITITPAHTLVLVSQRELKMTEGSLFAGGGFLTEAARAAGFKPLFAVEIEPDYAEVFERNHPGAHLYNCSVEQVPWEVLKSYRPLGLLTAGIPCEPYSEVRHWDRGTDAEGKQIRRDRSLPAEAHPNGDMTFWTLRAIEATNAHTVIMENVPGYLKSSSYYVLRNALQRLGYFVDTQIINPVEYGELTTRKRAIIIARTGAAPVWPEPVPAVRRLGDIFDADHAENGAWFNPESKPWLYNHWKVQSAKGNGFASQQVTADSPNVGTITKRYFAQQGQHPVVKHPTLPDTHRWFSLAEVKRLHGIPDDYYIGDSKTLAGELIGQGVVVTTMRDIIAANVRAA